MKLEDLVGPTHVDIAPEMPRKLLEPSNSTDGLDLGGLLARIYADAGLLLRPTPAALEGVDLAKLIVRIHADAQELLVRYQGERITGATCESIAERRRRLAHAE